MNPHTPHLFFDISTFSTGVCVRFDDTAILTKITDDVKDFRARIHNQKVLLIPFLENFKEVQTQIYFENYAFSRSSIATTRLGEVAGVYAQTCFDVLGKFPNPKAIPSTSWKAFCVGKGNASKDQVADKFFALFPQFTKKDLIQDQIDAFFLSSFIFQNNASNIILIDDILDFDLNRFYAQK